MNLEDKVFKWFDERFKLKDLLTSIIKHPAPEYAVTNPLYCLGGIAFLCFLILVATGIFLAMYYKPTPLEAYKSVEHIMTAVPMGSLIQKHPSLGCKYDDSRSNAAYDEDLLHGRI